MRYTVVELIIIGGLIIGTITVIAGTMVVDYGDHGVLVKQSYATKYGWTENVTVFNETSKEWEVVPNPETKLGLVKRKVGESIKDVIRAVEGDSAGEAARTTAVDNITNNVTISVE